MISPFTSPRRFVRLLPPVAITAACLALPASSLAQATRTWVSGVGDDANPCSRTAPCKTFAGAISKTAAGGEIDVLDPGGFGAVTITKSITIDGGPFTAGVLVSGTNGIVVSAGSTDRIILRHLDIDGLNTSLAGVKFLSGLSLRIENSTIQEFTGAAVDAESSTPAARVAVDRTTINGNAGSGVLAISGAGGGAEQVMVTNSQLDGNGCGISAGGACGGAATNALGVVADSVNSQIINSNTGPGIGIYSVGSTAAQVLSGDTITGNTTGLSASASGLIFSFGNNALFGNGTNGVPTSNVTPKARDLSHVVALVRSRAKAIARRKARARHHRHRRARNR